MENMIDKHAVWLDYLISTIITCVCPLESIITENASVVKALFVIHLPIYPSQYYILGITKHLVHNCSKLTVS